MKSQPILFKGPFVRAILEGRKTQTRRIVKLTGPKCASDCKGVEPERAFRDPGFGAGEYMHLPCRDGAAQRVRCPYGDIGDGLWIKETWAHRLDNDHLNGSQLYAAGVREAWYWADGPGKCCNTGCAGAAGRVRIARFMPRWASRISLRITDVRVQRLQEISEEDAIAEGVGPLRDDGRLLNGFPASDGFADGWSKINGPGSWESNPWVWCLMFERVGEEQRP